jgi:hypothetical protein
MKTEENNKEFSGKLPEGTDNFTGGFSVPDNYFEKLQSDIAEKASRIPILYTTKSENPYAVPDGYFTELEISIQKKVSLAKERVASRPLYLRPRFVTVLGAVLILLISTVTFITLNRTHHSVSEKDISFNDIYRSSYATEFDESALIEMIDDSTLNSATTPYENYLIDENTDLNTITEEL